MRHWLAFVIAASLWAPALVRGQQVKAEPAPPENSAHQELRALRDELIGAFNKNDLNGLLLHVTEDVVATWQNAEVSRGHQGVRDYYNRMMVGKDRVVKSVTAQAEVDDLTRLFGQDKDSGLAFGRLEEDFKLTNGMSFRLSNRWTAHVVKDAGRWKLSAFHVSANLFANPVLDIVMRRTTFWTGGLALPLGFALGWIAARAFSRRRRGVPT